MFEPLREPPRRARDWIGSLVSGPCDLLALDAFLLVSLTGIYGILIQVQFGFMSARLVSFLVEADDTQVRH